MDLRALAKRRVIYEMFDPIKPTFPWKVLVLDEHSMKVLSSAMKLFDLTDENISVVEKINLKRKPMKDMDAIYFISPKEESVNRVIEDFEPNRRLYAACHLFFTSSLSDELFQRLSSAPVAKFIKTLKEANCDFLVCESQVFTTDIVLNPESISSFTKLYSNDKITKNIEIIRIAKQIASVCSTLGEYPVIRYASSHDPDATLSKMLATEIQKQIDELYRLDQDISTNEGARAVLLVLDRSFDPITPLIHELTYQAMVYDLLQIENQKYSYQATDASGKNVTKTSTLDDDDDKWKELRHLFIADCINKITKDFDSFVKENEGLRSKGDSKTKSLKDIGAMIRAAPQYAEKLSKFSLHLSLTQSAMSVFNTNKIQDLAHIEQCIATGETPEGEPYKNPIPDIIPIVNDFKRSNYDKLRLLLLYAIQKGGLSHEEKSSLVNNSGLSEREKLVLDNLHFLGIKHHEARKVDKKLKEKKKSQKDKDDTAYDLSRYVPALKKIFEQLSEGTLSSEEFPFLKETPVDDEESRKRGISMRSSKSNWAKGQKKEDPNRGARIIVYVAGGITYSEMRCVYETPSKDLLLGSTQVYTPKEFIDQTLTLIAK